MKIKINNKSLIIIAIIFLVVVNSTLFVFSDKFKIKKTPLTLRLPYGSTISTSIKSKLRFNNKQNITVLLLIHPFIDYSEEIIWANLLKKKSKNSIAIKIISYNLYQYWDKIKNNEIEFIIDKKKAVFTQLGNLGKSKLKLVILKSDTVIYCNHNGINIIEEAGGIIKQNSSFEINQPTYGYLTNIQHSKSMSFRELKSHYNYYLFYRSVCAKCKGGVLLEAIVNTEKYKNNCAIIFSSFNNSESISAFLKKNKLNKLHCFIADSSYYSWFKIVQEPTIYQKTDKNLKEITRNVFLHKIKG